LTNTNIYETINMVINSFANTYKEVFIFMGLTITFGTEKGGSAKTTSSGVIAYLLSKKHKVLAVDLDLQGNMSELLSGVRDVTTNFPLTVFDAMKNKDANGCIYELNSNLHLLPANTFLSGFHRYLYLEYYPTKQDVNHLLRETLLSIKDQYDYIIIDTPPALGEITLNALVASDYVVLMFEASMFGHSALNRYLDTILSVKQYSNP